MASVSKVGGGWQVRWRDPDRKQRAKMCRTKAEAQRWARNLEVNKDRGDYIDPQGWPHNGG